MPIRSQTRNSQTRATRSSKRIRRQRSRLLAVPGQPVGEQQDVAGLLLDHRLERVDQRRREEAGAAGKLEQAEGEEAVDAFASNR